MTTSAALGAVVVGVDATTHSDAALAWAARYATGHRRPLLLTHAAGVPTVYESFAGPTENRKELRIAGRRTTDRALAQVRALDVGLDVRVHMALGTPHDVLLDSLDGAHLLVVGSRGRGSLASAVLGSVSTGLAASASCPVVVVRPVMARDEHSPFADQVVVGVDGSDVSLAALEHAFEMASSEHVGLVLLHAWGRLERDPESLALHRLAQEEHHLLMAESMAGFAEQYPDVAVTEYHTQGDAGRELARVSEDVRMVVVGSRGRGDSASVIFGSVSRYVLHHARCPVMVVRKPISSQSHEAVGASS